MQRRESLASVVRLICVWTACCAFAFLFASPSHAAPPASAGSHLQIPLYEIDGSGLPAKNEVCWVTNVCASPVQAHLTLTDALGNRAGNAVTQQLDPWQSYDCNVLRQLGLAAGATASGTLDATAPPFDGDGCLVADTCRLDGQTIACSQMWVTAGARQMDSCTDYIAHFVQVAPYQADIKYDHQPAAGPVTVEARDNDGHSLGRMEIPGDLLANRYSVRQILATLGHGDVTEGNLYVHLPAAGAVETEESTGDSLRRSRIPAWCLSPRQLPCDGTLDACGVCNGDGSTCTTPGSGNQAALTCSPLEQTTRVGEEALLHGANCSTGTFQWSAPQATMPSGTGATFGVTYTTAGRFPVTLSCDGTTAVCYVNTTRSAPEQQPVSCSPKNQTVTVGQSATLSASGGNGGPYGWMASGGSPASGSGTAFSTVFSTTGTATVTVTANGVSDSCSVDVVAPSQPTCTVTPGSLTANPGGDAGPFQYSVSNATSVTATCGVGTLSTGGGSFTVHGVTTQQSCTLQAAGSSGAPAVCPFSVLPQDASPGPGQGGALTCAPVYQEGTAGEALTFTAGGGSGSYTWSADGGAAPASASGAGFTTSWSQPGRKTVTVTDGSAEATCQAQIRPAHRPPACHLALSPSTVRVGDSTVLHWAISGAPPGDFASITLSQGSTVLGSSTQRTGKMVVTPDGAAGSTVTYDGTVYGHDGSVESTCQETVRMVAARTRR